MIFPLLKSLNSLPLQPIMLVIGPDPWLRQQICQSLINRALGSAMKEMNFAQFDSKEEGVLQALQACGEYPCFAEKRVVSLKNLEKISKNEVGPFKKYLEDPQASTLLLLETEKLDGRLDWVKVLKKQAHCIEFEAVSFHECIDWVKICLKRENKNYEEGVPHFVVEMMGRQFGMLQNTVQQLCLYMGKNDTLKLDDCSTVLARVSEENVFELIEALFSQDLAEFHRSFAALLEAGEAPLKILALAYRHLSILLEIKFAKAGESSTLSPWLQRKYQSQVVEYRQQLNFDLLKPLVEADQKLKGSPLKAKFVLENAFEKLAELLN